MKYIISTILDRIKNDIGEKDADEEMMVKINGFSNPEIYRAIADEISAFCNAENISLNIKLAHKRYKEFSEEQKFSSTLDYMKQNEWIAFEQSITYYRNLHSSKLLVLFGTESEDDKDGLLNCSEITPESIARNLKGEYCRLFKENAVFSEDDEKIINKLYKDLFDFVPPDICHLSEIADRWTDISDIDEFIDRFYSTLPEWKLPFRKENLWSPKDILNSKRNILQIENALISHSLFNDISPSKLEKYLKKFGEYECSTNAETEGETGKFAEPSFDWSGQAASCYKEYVSLLTDFIIGKNIDENRSKLLKCDISIAEDIFGLKLATEPKDKKEKDVNIFGSPLSVFMVVLLNGLARAKNEDEQFSKLRIKIKKASIVTGLSQTENDDGKDSLNFAWKNFCIHTNGVIEYIQNNKQWKLDSEPVSLELVPTDIFSPESFDNSIVECASATKKSSCIEFETLFLDSHGKEIKDLKSKYRWNFSSNESWLNNFSVFADTEILENEESFIPLTELKNIKDLISTTSEDEFFDLLFNSDIAFGKKDDICNFILNKLSSSSDLDKKLKNAFTNLGSDFVRFGKALVEKGYFSLLTDTDSSLYKFIGSYERIGQILSEQLLPDNRKYIYDAFIHSFCIEKNGNSVRTENETDCVIVPAWNPVALEKMNAQKSFFLDGCEEWWKNASELKNPQKRIAQQMNVLKEMCIVKNSVVVFPEGCQKLFGAINSFGAYSLYASDSFENESRVKDLIQKDLVFDDTFTKDELVGDSEDSKMILRLINSYTKSFAYTKTNLKLVFINPVELQSVVSAIYGYIKSIRDKDSETKISIELQFLIKPENRGGKNYLSYWMNEFFSEDNKTSVKTYLNEWYSFGELQKMIEPNNDIVFFMDFLKSNNFSFSDFKEQQFEGDSCKFPIVYKPKPVSNTSGAKRSVELSQPQFKAEHYHTTAVYCRRENRLGNVIAAQEMKLDEKSHETIYRLHQKSNWVICIDGGLDGALLKNENSAYSDDYSVIGFSTGNGNYGKYNVTITARKEILKIIEGSFKVRLSHLFHWDSDIINKVVSRCVKEAAGLDGISLLSAINLRDNNINEFMAYVLTSFREKTLGLNSPLKVLIHLDSYKHWFTDEIIDNFDDSNSRTDFLSLEVNDSESEKLVIRAKVVECKISTINYSDVHKEKAIRQVCHSLKRLKQIFTPESSDLKSIMRRYWFAQLYRALTFAQVTFSNTSLDYERVAEKLRLILDGNFEINWSGEVLGYWFDMDGDTEIIEEINNDDCSGIIKIHNVPQMQMQKLLVGDEFQHYGFVKDFDESLLLTTSEKIAFNETNESDDDKNDISTANVESSSSNNPSDHIQQDSSESQSQQIAREPSAVLQTEQDKAISETEGKKELKDIRVLIGKDRMGQDVFWEFGNPGLTNRHLLITGTSGQGKTYCIQTMLYELSKSNVSSVIFDYTEGFRLDQIDENFRDKIGDKFHQRIVKVEHVPINPFKIFEQDIAGRIVPESSVDVANRLKSIFSHVYRFGDQQEAAIYEAVKNGIDKYGEKLTMELFINELGNVNNKSVPTVISKIRPFADAVNFVVDEKFNWEQIVYPEESQCFVFQLTAYDRDTQVIITELLLWNLWYYSNKVGKKDRPFVVVLDEAQNLSHKKGSPSEKILTEGRKFGWSAWFATQSLQVLNDDEVTRLLQSAFKLYFKPTDAEIVKMAKQLDPQDFQKWLGVLKKLNKGQCIVVGDRCNSSGSFVSTMPTVTSVTPMQER